MDRGLREQSFACTASDRLIRLRSRDVSSTASKTLQTSVIAFSVYFRSEAPLLIPRPQELCTAWAWRLHEDLAWKKDSLNPIEYAAWTHAEFVRIHPFIDGNGRTSRLLMNYQLMYAGFLPVSIAKEDRLEYYNALEAYATLGNLEPFADLIAELEEKQLDIYLGLIRQVFVFPANAGCEGSLWSCR